MDFDPAGISMAAIALTICCFGRQAALCAAFGCMVFGTTAVVSLRSLGQASVTLPQFGLLLLIGVALSGAGATKRAIRALTEDSAAQLLVVFAFLAMVGAIFLPRLLNWQVEVYSIDRFLPDRTNQVPLVPSTGNISQSLYLLGSVAAFFASIMTIQTERDVRQLLTGIKTLIVLQVTLASIDIVAKYGFGTDVLAFMRTAHYDMLTDGDIAGAWRITGAYSEASFLATALAGQMAFCFAFWCSGDSDRFFPLMFGVLAFILVLSTSSSAFVFLGGCGLWWTMKLVYQLARGRVDPPMITLALILPCAIVGLCMLALLLFQTNMLDARAHQFTDQLLFDKMSTVSGRERAAWNEAALRTLVDTYGIGVGLGSTKTSSWPLALMSQTGLGGTILYAAFIMLLIAPQAWRKSPPTPGFVGLQRSCKAYIIAMILVASISWSYVDLGLVFNILAGLTVALAHRSWYAAPTIGWHRGHIQSVVSHAAGRTSRTQRCMIRSPLI